VVNVVRVKGRNSSNRQAVALKSSHVDINLESVHYIILYHHSLEALHSSTCYLAAYSSSVHEQSCEREVITSDDWLPSSHLKVQ